MPTLVVNAGSSSHKLVLFGDTGERLWSGAIDWSDRGGAWPKARANFCKHSRSSLSG